MYGMPIEPSRKIVISSEIDNVLAKEIIEQIIQINDLDDEREDALNGYNRHEHPIEIFINSGGGSVSDGFAIISAMEMCNTTIVTYATGICASMALAIFVAGDIRIATRHSRLMYHGIAYGMLGHITDHKYQMEEAELLQRMYNSLILERTSFPEGKMEEIGKMKKDYFFSAKEAVKHGIAHKYTTKPEQMEVEFETEQE